ncbi:MAG: hypothetical protein WAS21_24225 [Geminicoccaceae bacterium]
MSSMKQKVLVAAGCILGAAGSGTFNAALAGVDIPGSASTTAVLPLGPGGIACEVNAPFDSDWYKVALTKDQSYAVRLSLGDDEAFRVAVRDSTGTIVVSASGDNEAPTGVEFRAAYTGKYFVELKDQAGYSSVDYCKVAIAKDCANDLGTQCKLPLNVATPGTLFSPKDTDYWKFPVVGGKKYRVTIVTPDPNDDAIDLQALVLNSKGSAVSSCYTQQAGTKETCTTPPATATAKGFFFVKIPENFFAKSYTLSVKSN